MLVRRMTLEAPGIVSLELEALDGSDLPLAEPGAHIDLHLPDGTTRQYSLCGDPGDRSRWRIAVRDVAGGRASRMVHRGDLRPGSVVQARGPRNNFPLLPSRHYLFVAGGIGVTPLLPMMRQASHEGAAWTLLFCVRNAASAPFLTEIRAFGGEIVLHASEAGTRLDAAARLAQAPADTLLYCCGPETLMLAVEQAASAWPPGTVHFEWFTARSLPQSGEPGAFEAVCARSGRTLQVLADQSLLSVLTAAGFDVPSSCEQGVCGTCEVAVLDGEIDHRDSILSASERRSNALMMTCVSRAKDRRVVLDL